MNTTGLVRALICSVIITATSATANNFDCSASVERFFKEKLTLLSNFKPRSEFHISKNFKKVCKLEYVEMMDGLSYVLYKDTRTKSYYIQMHNGFDGTYKLYGPFDEFDHGSQSE